VLQRCIDEGLVGGEGIAVDASLIQADASDRTRVEGAAGLPPEAAARAVAEYLAWTAQNETTGKFRRMRLRFSPTCSAPKVQRPQALSRTWTADPLGLAESVLAPATEH
jgi:hypothetical protein